MTERYRQRHDAGKGPEDRSDASKRQACPLWKQVKVNDNLRLTPEEAAEAIREAILTMERIVEYPTDKLTSAIQWLAKHTST